MMRPALISKTNRSATKMKDTTLVPNKYHDTNLVFGSYQILLT